LDYSVIKETIIKEQTRLQFRAEFFNLLNHANFALPIASAFVQTPVGELCRSDLKRLSPALRATDVLNYSPSNAHQLRAANVPPP
jgi:hypothetical protein